VNLAKLDIKRLDQQFDLFGNRVAPALEFLGGGHEYRVTQGDVLRDVEELDFAVVDPGLNREFPAAQMAFHQQRIFFRRNVLNFFYGTNHPVSQTTRLVECLDVDWVIRIAVELEQGLVNTLHEAHDVVFLVSFFEYTDANAAKLGTALHQGLVAKQNGLPEHTGAIHQHGVYSTGPFNRFFKQRDGHINAFFFQRCRDLHGPIVQPDKIPRNERNVVGGTEIRGPFRRNNNVATVEVLRSLDGVDTPAEQGDKAFFRIFWSFSALDRRHFRVAPRSFGWR
jgi:hypothetical protein